MHTTAPTRAARIRLHLLRHAFGTRKSRSRTTSFTGVSFRSSSYGAGSPLPSSIPKSLSPGSAPLPFRSPDSTKKSIRRQQATITMQPTAMPSRRVLSIPRKSAANSAIPLPMPMTRNTAYAARAHARRPRARGTGAIARGAVSGTRPREFAPRVRPDGRLPGERGGDGPCSSAKQRGNDRRKPPASPVAGTTIRPSPPPGVPAPMVRTPAAWISKRPPAGRRGRTTLREHCRGRRDRLRSARRHLAETHVCPAARGRSRRGVRHEVRPGGITNDPDRALRTLIVSDAPLRCRLGCDAPAASPSRG